MKHEVVISGISGEFPKCFGFEELKEALAKKETLVELNPKNWKDPFYMGTLRSTNYFDSNYFGVHRKLCQIMDVSTRMLLERTFECMIDAGINPESMRGSHTAVCMGNTINEWELKFDDYYGTYNNHVMLGHARCMQANRISYFFNLKGPSFEVGSSPVIGLEAIKVASRMIMNGQVRQVLVGVSNVMFTSASHFNFWDAGIYFLNSDGKTRSFSDTASGYTKSEGIVVMLLQRKEDALRCYASIDRAEVEVVMDPTDTKLMNFKYCRDFLEDFYKNEDVDDISLMIADGIAVPDADAAELNAIEHAVCQRRKDPLWVTSVKSIMGHGEGTSPFFSILCGIYALQMGYVPPILYYSGPNPKIPSLVNGKINVVTDLMPFNGDKIAINCLGWTNHFGHMILRRTVRKEPILHICSPPEEIPYLIFLSGRDEEKMRKVLNKLKMEKEIDVNVCGLLHKCYSRTIEKQTYRSYVILKPDQQPIIEKSDYAIKRPLWFIYSGMGSQWLEMGKDLMKFDVIAKSFQKSHEVMKEKGIDLMYILTSNDTKLFDNILNAFVGIAAIQVALTDLLTSIGLVPDGIVGHSVGELGCAYSDGCMTAEQVLLAAYARGRASLEAKLCKGMMAAVGLGYKAILNMLPEGVEVACHNSSTSCTLTGIADKVEAFVETLKKKGIFARSVNVANIAYHSSFIGPAAPLLLKYLKEVIPNPKPRTNRWVSSSLPQDKWNTELAKYCSAEYHTNNLVSQVLFEEASALVPKNAVAIEIAPHGLLQAILKRSLAECTNISLTNRTSKDGIFTLLKALGTAYICGIEMDISSLYPAVTFPVPLKTRSLQEIVTWDHDELWCPDVRPVENMAFGLKGVQKITFDRRQRGIDLLYSSFVVNKIPVIPPAKVLVEVLNIFAINNEVDLTSNPVLIEDLKFVSNLELLDDGQECTLTMMETGFFEVGCKSQIILMGKITVMSDPSLYIRMNEDPFDHKNCINISKEQVYSFYREHEFMFKSPYTNIESISVSDQGFSAKVKYFAEMEYLFNAIFSTVTFYQMYETNNAIQLQRIGLLALNPNEFLLEEEATLNYNTITGNLTSHGILISMLKAKPFSHSIEDGIEMNKQIFLPYSKLTLQDDLQFYEACAQFIAENKAVDDSPDKMVLSYDIIGNRKSNEELNRKVAKYCATQVNAFSLTMEEFLTLAVIKDLSEWNKTVLVTYEGNSLPVNLDILLKSERTVFLILYVPAGNSFKITDDLTIVYEQNMVNHNILLIKKKVNSVNPNNVIVVKSGEEPKKLEKNKLLNGTNESPVYIIKEYQLFSEIDPFISKILEMPSNNIRLIFVDKKSPPIDVNSSFYQDVLRNDFKITICYGNVLGSRKRLPVGDTESKPESTIVNDSISAVDETTNVKIVGIGFNELVCPDSESEMTVMEYSGINAKGKSVFGVCQLGAVDKQLRLDPFLRWEVPTSWTLQQSATVPLFYSLAYYLLIIKGMLKRNDTLFIHAGYSLLSQAIIEVAFSMNCLVFTSCSTKAQREFILKRFPQFKESHVLDSTSGAYSLLIMDLTDGRGVDLAINTLGTEQVQYSLELLFVDEGLLGGRFIQVGRHPLTGNYCFGMNIFNRKCGVFGFATEELHSLRDDEKKWIRDQVIDGIKEGAVKPLGFVSFPAKEGLNNLNTTVLKNIASVPSKKILLDFSKNAKGASSTVHFTSSLIVGSQNGLWFDVMSWLICHDVTKFYIMVDKEHISPFIRRRLENFQKKYPEVLIELHPIKTLNSGHECELLVQMIQKNSNLETAFYITSDSENISEPLDMALRKYAKDCRLISIGKYAELISEKRNRDGYKSIALLMSPKSRNCSVIAAVEKILTTNRQRKVTLDLVHIWDEQDYVPPSALSLDNRLPEDISSLLDIHCTINDKYSLLPLKSASARYETNKEAVPLIVIPGFKVRKIVKFVKDLPYATYLSTMKSNEPSLSKIATCIALEIIRKFEDLASFNIICEGWSGALALLVTHYLEMQGKQCFIIMLDAAPEDVQKAINNITELKILSKYLPMTKELMLSVNQKLTWEEKLSEILQQPEHSEFNTKVFIESISLVRIKVKQMQEYKIGHCQSNAKVVLLVPKYLAKKFSSRDLNLACKREVKVINLTTDNVFSRESIEHIVSCPAYEFDHCKGRKDIEEITNSIDFRNYKCIITSKLDLKIMQSTVNVDENVVYSKAS